MLARLRSQLTVSNVVSVMALFVALSGGAYALTIPRNSVSAKQLKKDAVRASEIKKGAVRSSEVKDASLLLKDFKPGQVPAGPAGQDGAPGATNVVVRTQEPCNTLPANVHCVINLQCQPGERATGGGAGFTDLGGNEILDVSQPVEADGTNPEAGDMPTGWTAAIEYTTGGPRHVIGYAICASP